MTNQNHKEQIQGCALEELYELCYHAHTGVSFHPERRAVMYIKSYSEMLEEDLKLLGDHTANYKSKFIQHFQNWMSAKTNCLSSMIAGPSNFPVRRAEKANNAEHNKYEAFMHWRTKYFQAVNRVPTKSPEEDLEIAERHLEQQLTFQLRLKEINKIIRKSKLKNLNEIIALLRDSEFEFSVDEISCISDDYKGGYKVPGYTLTNLNARIKGNQDKIKARLARIETKKSWEDITFDGGYVTIEDDRVKIFHDQKPEQEIISEIKRNGFKWSRYWTCWCRKHTQNAIYRVQSLSFIKGVA